MKKPKDNEANAKPNKKFDCAMNKQIKMHTYTH